MHCTGYRYNVQPIFERCTLLFRKFVVVPYEPLYRKFFTTMYLIEALFLHLMNPLYLTTGESYPFYLIINNAPAIFPRIVLFNLFESKNFLTHFSRNQILFIN